jgi:hypothetical protein
MVVKSLLEADEAVFSLSLSGRALWVVYTTLKMYAARSGQVEIRCGIKDLTDDIHELYGDSMMNLSQTREALNNLCMMNIVRKEYGYIAFNPAIFFIGEAEKISFWKEKYRIFNVVNYITDEIMVRISY